jgi:hypothetical protein
MGITCKGAFRIGVEPLCWAVGAVELIISHLKRISCWASVKYRHDLFSRLGVESVVVNRTTTCHHRRVVLVIRMASDNALFLPWAACKTDLPNRSASCRGYVKLSCPLIRLFWCRQESTIRNEKEQKAMERRLGGMLGASRIRLPCDVGSLTKSL